ncbi:short-chain dehydrogenase/reductase [Sugiyamaella lignohabitans]|uniref:Short-chain dehydrogenase/reductase n=1 Tax=Sugiyamaella lignohabitans TaxID=796027 RepID=A0A167EPQ5_9ASCO|nr:short-chain dehydrogenase/reductase [Sugiyamaella lignohabitans]ANB14318.1 short-chain dehydrogenase/reductase [Sugiyamaella lignohabitans]
MSYRRTSRTQVSTRTQTSTLSSVSGTGIVTPTFNILPPVQYNRKDNNVPRLQPVGHHNHHSRSSWLAHDLHRSYHSTTQMIKNQAYRPLVKINPGLDLVLITGGASGLGYQMALLFHQKGFEVIVLDIHVPERHSRIPKVTYYQCDVSNIEEISAIAKTIRDTHGTVTVLVNNAGVMKGAKKTVDLGYTEMRTTLDINLLASFLTVRTFVPDMVSRHRGYVVTIGSVLGYVSPAKLSLYGASKAGLIALHESLTHELGPPNFPETGVRTLLVSPGQLKTSLFMDVRSPYVFIAPVLEPSRAARAVVEALEKGSRGELKLPLYVNGTTFLRTLPHQLATATRALTGIDSSI